MTKIEQEARDNPSSVQGMLDSLKESMRRSRGNARVIRSMPGAAAVVTVSENLVDISASSVDGESSLGVSVIEGCGTLIKGPLGISGSPSDVRIGGMWKFNDVLTSAAPSTILTPIPVLRFNLPAENMARLMATNAITAALLGVF